VPEFKQLPQQSRGGLRIEMNNRYGRVTVYIANVLVAVCL
jgi:hypothetical protein